MSCPSVKQDDLITIGGKQLKVHQARKEVHKKFRAKISPYLASLMKKSPYVAKQFVPDPLELEEFGTEAPFEEGRENSSVYGLERIYADRVVLTPYFECSAYCRYCFKKTRTLGGNGKMMSDGEISAAMDYIRADSKITTALITGGDPFVDTELLVKVLDQVSQIPHITKIRVGTRNVLFAPELVTDELADKLATYNRINYDDLDKSLNLSIGISINHPDELAPEVVTAVHRLISRGIGVRGQVTLLKGINDNIETLTKLYDRFLMIGIIPYYLLHCMPVTGAKHFRTSVQKGIDLIGQLAPITGAMAPLYVYCSPVGKHRMGTGHHLEYEMIDGKRYIKTVTPYKAEDFFKFTGKTRLPPLHDINEDGMVVSRYLDADDE